MTLLTSEGEMIRLEVSMKCLSGLTGYNFLHLQCALCVCIHISNNKILQLDDT